MFKVFIERPVLSTVISIIIVILGMLGLVSLPVTQYPDIAPPTVSVSATYQGANAEAVINSVITPLEKQINGVEGMDYMSSTAASDGSATIDITFKSGTDPDMAAVNVQNRVTRATSLLPAEVTRAGVSTSKRQSGNVLIFGVYSEDSAYNETFVQNYVNINLLPQLKRINGVGNVGSFGVKDYSMRIWLRPDVMAAYGLVPDDINAALAEQNIEAAPGSLGENAGQSFQYSLKYKGRLKNELQFSDIIIKVTPDGQILKLKDVARIEMGAQTYSLTTTARNFPGVGIFIQQTAGSNAQKIIEESQEILRKASISFPKGIKYSEFVNVNNFLDASIDKVIETLIEAFVLVFIVVFVFLQDWRSTIIPAISVPVAIIGTFFFMYLFGYSINLLTLFALVLAVGIVVDDAIVVVEAVHTKMDQGEHSARKAAEDAMSEIGGVIVSITLVMAAVFVPVSFITGSSGVFYQQFGLTLAVAIIISAINALTLSPALCAIFLKPHEGDKTQKHKTFIRRFYSAFNATFDAISNKYKNAIGFLGKKKWITVAALVSFGALLVGLERTTPSEFVPNEDQGVIMSDISLPVGSSIERVNAVVKEVRDIANSFPETDVVFTASGQGMISGMGTNYGMVIIKLKPWGARKGKNQDVRAIINQLFTRTAAIKDGKVIFFSLPTITGFGISSGFSLELQDKTGGNIGDFYKVSQNFRNALSKRPEIQFASISFNPYYPQYEVNLDIARIKKAGFTGNQVLNAIQGYYGSVYASNFNSFGKQYRVIYQSDIQYRADPQSINLIKVRSMDGTMAPISEFVSLDKTYAAQSLDRFNLFTSISVTGAPNAGYSSGDAAKVIEEVAKTTLPTGYSYEFSGATREEASASSQTIFIYILCLIFVYFLLSAQYESYILPLSVIFSLLVGLSGIFVFARLFGITNNIYLQISLVMLIGLLAKNAILIVQYALARRKSGMSIVDAAINGAQARLRPILMTAFAFILGLSPLMFATGAGAAGNRSIGTGAIGGMIFGTVFGLFIIPVLFIIFQSLHEKLLGKPKASLSSKQV